VELVMRARYLLLGLVAACTPEITSGSYLCGEQESCPPDLRCDGETATCVFARDVMPFVCPEGTNDAEPDDDIASALDIGTAGCGALAFSDDGCIDAADDVDHVAFTTPADCDGMLDVKLRFSLAFAPIGVDLLDDSGAVVASGAQCGTADSSGQITVCLTAPVDPTTAYVLRIDLPSDAPTCGGACAFNSYQLSIL
jgi:hypothetical protein